MTAGSFNMKITAIVENKVYNNKKFLAEEGFSLLIEIDYPAKLKILYDVGRRSSYLLAVIKAFLV